ncbi:MAG: TraX family protein [Candidatus Fimadaptatus sp.]
MQDLRTGERPAIALNTDTGLLKLVAIVLMVVDHVGYQLMGNDVVMRSIGRLAFPMFAWCVVVGSEYTHDIKGYMKRMALFYFVTQPCYVLAFGRTWTQHNIYLTLLLGLIAIWAIRDREYWVLPMTLLAAYFMNPNYGMDGVYVIILFYLVRRSKLLAALVMTAFCLYWGRNSLTILTIGDWKVGMQSLAALSLPLIILPTHTGIRLNKYVFYAFYPVHLLIIYAIKQLMAAQ